MSELLLRILAQKYSAAGSLPLALGNLPLRGSLCYGWQSKDTEGNFLMMLTAKSDNLEVDPSLDFSYTSQKIRVVLKSFEL